MSHIKLTPVDYNPFEDEKEIQKIVLLNESQKEIWLSCVIGEDESNLAYNESVSLDLLGSFEPEHFVEAIRMVVARHEALRSTVSADGEMLIIYKNMPFSIPAADISSSEDKKAFLDNFIATEMQNIFNLQEGPLFRVFLHKLNDTHHFFTLVIHHIIGDGWSKGVILEDLSKIYNSKIKDISPVLDSAPQISKYALEQADFRQTEKYQLTENYWLDMYKDKVPVLDLPTDYPRPVTRTYKANRIDSSLPLELVTKLKTLGAKTGSSLVNTLLGAFEVFLHLQTNQRDVVVGLPAAGQAATENFGLVGHCVNLLPLKSYIDPEASFSEYLKKRKGEFFDAYENQNFTYGQLIKKLNIKRDSSRIPLVPVMFNIDMGMDTSIQFDNLDFNLISNPRAYETFEIFLNVTGSKSSFILEWSYNTQLFKATTIEKMAKHFEQLLETISNDSSITIKELSLKNTAVWKEQLKLWNDTNVSYQKNSHLSLLIDKVALSYPDKIAIVFKEENLTYRDLIIRSNQFSDYLIQQGIKAGDIIGLTADRSIDMVVSLLGILKAGAAYLPLDPEYPHERIEFMLEDSKARMLLVSKPHQSKFKSDAAEVVLEDIWPELEKYSKQTPSIAINGDYLAYVLYTSGSTGKPKGVKIMHYNLINFLTSMQVQPGITPEDRLLAITTISFDIAGLELYLPLISGAQLIICDTETARDGRILVELIAEKNITFMQATPSTWRMMIDSGWIKTDGLKALCGGEALPRELSDNLLEKVAELWNMYGPTETTIWSTIKKINADDQVLTIGKPIHNTQIYILNEENELVPPGNTGEIFIGGDGVAAGYLNRPELTNERFIQNPFSAINSEKIYKTGDLGRFTDSGEIVYQGRIDQQVKIRGHRIELGEIETLISNLGGIKQAVVVAREDVPGNVRIVGYVTLTDHIASMSSVDEVDVSRSIKDGWKNNLREFIPEYMIPGEFVALTAFPLTPNHKIDKKALPQPKGSTSDKEGNEHQSENEKIISDIWSSVLGIKNININDDFFDLGGHSLLAVNVMARIEKKTGKRLPLATLFENSTVANLAKKIQSEEAEKWDSLVPIKTTGTKDPIFLIHGAGLNVILFKSFSKHLDPDQPVYGLQALGLNRPTQLLYSIEEIAAVYKDEILKVNPEGPYCLAGFSLGGFIAYEIARQLLAAGKTIKFLGVIDSYAGHNIQKLNPSSKLTKKIIRQFNKIPFFIKSFVNSPKEAFNYQLYIVKYKLKHLLDKEIEEEVGCFNDYEREIYSSYDIASDKYQLMPMDVKVVLISVKTRLYFLDDPIYLGWNKLAKGGLQIQKVPGDHATFLNPPNDIEFAHTLQQALNNA